MIGGTEYDEKNKFHLVFVRKRKPKGRKTNVYVIEKRMDIDTTQRYRLGEVRWYGAFRQYCSFPDNNTVWSWGCNDLVNRFLKKVNDRYRRKQKKEREKCSGY